MHSVCMSVHVHACDICAHAMCSCVCVMYVCVMCLYVHVYKILLYLRLLAECHYPLGGPPWISRQFLVRFVESVFQFLPGRQLRALGRDTSLGSCHKIR